VEGYLVACAEVCLGGVCVRERGMVVVRLLLCVRGGGVGVFVGVWLFVRGGRGRVVCESIAVCDGRKG
jgi:hypothetical protein